LTREVLAAAEFCTIKCNAIRLETHSGILEMTI